MDEFRERIAGQRGWIGGFMAKIRCCQPQEAELLGVLDGIRMAADMGMRRMIVEVGSAEVFEELRSIKPNSTCHDSIVKEIQAFI
ncbi:hypothetical protein AHAS_Ahas10G0056000 [Arachis hypogaea]